MSATPSEDLVTQLAAVRLEETGYAVLCTRAAATIENLRARIFWDGLLFPIGMLICMGAGIWLGAWAKGISCHG